MQKTQPEQLGVFVYLQAHFDLSGLFIRKVRELYHMKIVVLLPGIEPGPSTLRERVLSLHHHGNQHRVHMQSHPVIRNDGTQLDIYYF